MSAFFLIALTIFAVVNLFAAGALGAGAVVLIALWLRRKAEFWPLLMAMALIFGGGGALGAAWGAYWLVSQRTPDWGWPVLSWICGYLSGGSGGALLGALGVALRRRHELPLIESQFKERFNAFKTQISTLGLRQTLRIGAYSLRFVVSRK